MAHSTANYLIAQAYVGEAIGGYGIAGSRHSTGMSEDALWPSQGVKLPQPQHVGQAGKLYLLSDGVTKCADGRMASQLLVRTIGEHYYARPSEEMKRPAVRLTCLQEAVWQAHLALMAQSKKLYQKDDQLQATILAALLYEQYFFVVAIGDSAVLHIPADSKRPIEWLYRPKKEQFMGNPILRYQRAAALPYREIELKAGDFVVLCSDGVFKTLAVWKGEIEWGTYLRQKLAATPITSAVPDLIKGMHRYRSHWYKEELNDDLTLFAIAVPDQAPLEARLVESVATSQSMLYRSGDLIGESYVVEKQIYEGPMSQLYLVRDKRSANRRAMVAKVPNTQQYGAEQVLPAFERESRLMAMLRHPNLLPCEESGKTASSSDAPEVPYLIMPYIQGVDLRSLLSHRQQRQSKPEGLRLVDVQAIFNALLSAVEYLYEQGWVHCNLKPSQILIGNDEQVFLTGLGAATPIGDRAYFHSPAYSAPETGARRPITIESDIYSLGKMLFELVSGKGPATTSPWTDTGTKRTIVPSGLARAPVTKVTLESLLQSPEYGLDFAYLINKATKRVAKDRYPDVKALREALDDVYTRPRPREALEAEGAANLAQLVQDYYG